MSAQNILVDINLVIIHNTYHYFFFLPQPLNRAITSEWDPLNSSPKHTQRRNFLNPKSLTNAAELLLSKRLAFEKSSVISDV